MLPAVVNGTIVRASLLAVAVVLVVCGWSAAASAVEDDIAIDAVEAASETDVASEVDAAADPMSMPAGEPDIPVPTIIVDGPSDSEPDIPPPTIVVEPPADDATTAADSQDAGESSSGEMPDIHVDSTTADLTPDAPADDDLGTGDGDVPWNLGPAPGVNAQAAWDQGATGDGVLVAVIDTGIDITHPALADQIWTNPGEIADNGIDDDQNGYVDDVHGWDWVNDDNTVYDPADGDAHGTHVGGIIVQAAPDGYVLPLKVLGPAGGYSSDAAQAVLYAVAAGAQVINASWSSSTYSAELNAAIEYAASQGVLFVTSAGSGGYDTDVDPLYPARGPPNVIVVASVDADGALSAFSNYGATTVDVAAPGANIYSTVPGGGYGYRSGTSMAAAHASGATALSLSAGQSPGVGFVVTSSRLGSVVVSEGVVDALSTLRLAGAASAGAADSENQRLASPPPGSESSGTALVTAATFPDLEADAVTITTYPTLSSGYPRDMTVGPNGNVWWTNQNGTTIGRIAPDGTGGTTFPAFGNPSGIMSGPCPTGTGIWWGTAISNTIGRMAPDGTGGTTFPALGTFSHGITSGPCPTGTCIWWTNVFSDTIGRMAPDGTGGTTFPALGTFPYGIMSGLRCI